MRVTVSKSKNSITLYIIKSVWDSKKQTSTTKVVENLGSPEKIIQKYNCKDPYLWAKQRAKKLTELDNANNLPVSVKFSRGKEIKKDEERFFNAGYLYLKDIYYKLRIDEICENIKAKYKIKYDLNNILENLIYSRIIYPGSKKFTYEISKRYVGSKKFELHQTYRALDIIAKESTNIEACLYKNSQKLYKRHVGVLYYDVTNYYFDIDYEDDFRKYGKAKSHKPNPIVNMGLIMDLDGIPLSFSMYEGNKNEQQSLRPIEEKIIKDYGVERFVMCTDAGLSSKANKKFNTQNDRSYITVQSIKKLKKHLKDYCLGTSGWYIEGSNRSFDLDKISNSPELRQKYYNNIFYKYRQIKENDLEEQLIVTFSFRYLDYARNVRNKQITRAKKDIAKGQIRRGKNQNDPARFVKETDITHNGEAADKKILQLNTKKIEEEEAYDGFYAIVTNLEDDPYQIAKINHNRWKIEKCFRDLKSEFKSGTIHLSRENRIKAHFMTCFMALLIFRLLEKKLDYAFSTEKISRALRECNITKLKEGYIPSFERTDITDLLKEKFDFSLTEEIIIPSDMKKIINSTKRRRYY